MSANLMSLARSGGKFLKLFGDRKMVRTLPYDAEVEYLAPQTLTYIEQYTTRIDTGISPTANTEVSAEMYPLNYNAGDQTIGARAGNDKFNRFLSTQ